MCGISGLVRARGISNQDAAAVDRMTEAMCQRGPDSQGVLLGDVVALGMRRLRIIDLETGDQPIYNTGCTAMREDGRTVAAIFNGEVYNYQGLRAELEDQGHRFRTRSDTEAIVHSYEQWGPDCLDRLRGMLALCIVEMVENGDGHPGQDAPRRLDGQRGKLRRMFLARDRLGVKPLYYFQGDGFFLFASEVRALLASGLVPRQLSLEGLGSYLAYGSVQEPLTMIAGIYSLPPGHWMTVDPEGPTLDLHKYWDLPTDTDRQWAPGKANEGEIVSHLRDLLIESVRLRLISDVPLGAFLSGGIDSGAVASLMTQTGDETPKTFNITFDETEFSEASLARETARRCGTDHREVRVSGAQVLAELPQANQALDQPSIDGVNTYYVSQAAKAAGLTVALSGLGGDEVFAGYEGFRTVPRMLRLQRLLGIIPSPMRHMSAGVWSAVGRVSDRDRKIAAFLVGESFFDHPYFATRMLFTPRQTGSLLQVDSAVPDGHNPWRQRVEGELANVQDLDPVNAVSYLECKNYLSSTLLRDTDAMSMAHSLEVRVPLLDHELIEFMMRLPGRLKIDPAMPKHLLVKSLDGALAPEVVHRRKSTFTFPWVHWLGNELKEEVEGTLAKLPQPLEGVVDLDTVRAVWERFLIGHTSWSRPWSLYVLFKWVQREIV